MYNVFIQRRKVVTPIGRVTVQLLSVDYDIKPVFMRSRSSTWKVTA